MQKSPSSTQRGFNIMRQEDELALKVTKEIVVKFIEMGRISMNSFDEVFRQVHKTVRDSLKDSDEKGKSKK
jgi:hypothetical protein